MGEQTPEQLDVKMPAAAEQATRFKAVANARPSRIRDLQSVAESDEYRELIAIHPLGFDFSGVRRDLLYRTTALGDVDLTARTSVSLAGWRDDTARHRAAKQNPSSLHRRSGE